MQKNSGLSAPGEIAGLLAREKALLRFVKKSRIVMSSAPIRRWRLGNRLFSKPAGRAQAADQLRLLAGDTHELHSAVAVARDGKIVFSDVSRRQNDDAPLERKARSKPIWIRPGEAVTTSVGAYQLEGLGVHLFERIEGDHFTILGLPLLPLLASCAARGCSVFEIMPKRRYRCGSLD